MPTSYVVSLLMATALTQRIHAEPAFSNFRFWMALGFVMNFVWGSFLVDQYHIKVKQLPHPAHVLCGTMKLTTTTHPLYSASSWSTSWCWLPPAWSSSTSSFHRSTEIRTR